MAQNLLQSLALPVDEILPELIEALSSGRHAVLQAPPGAGKTTKIPPVLLEQKWMKNGRIVMLEPRRLAAKASATRMAELIGEAPGETIGFRTRYESKVSRRTRIEVVTEGILTRRLQTNPDLEGVNLIIFDEFHERSVQSDLALAMCLDVCSSIREDLRLLVMSATLDGTAVARLLDNAPVIHSTGQSFPIDLEYLPADPDGRIEDAVVTACGSVVGEKGDVLVFLPGGGEIRRVAQRLNDDPRFREIVIAPLYGDLPRVEQNRAILPDPRGARRFVLATPIAETSLTIEGVRIVIDSGWMRGPRFDPRIGMTRLETFRVSKASADQRAGRAGRTAPGRCLRLWSEHTHRTLKNFNEPEILVTDPAPLVLETAYWGAKSVNDMTWLDPPREAGVLQAEALLRELEALDDENRITSRGRAMAELPLHPRLAHMVVSAKEHSLLLEALEIAALLNERDIFRRPDSDDWNLLSRLDALHESRSSSRRKVDGAAVRMIEKSVKQWNRSFKVDDKKRSEDDEDYGLLAALAYPDRIAENRGTGDGRYLLAGGRGARLARPPFPKERFLVAASVDAGTAESIIRLAVPLGEETIRRHFSNDIRTIETVDWNEETNRIEAHREERFHNIVLGRAPLDSPAPDKAAEVYLNAVQRIGLEILPWTEKAKNLQSRILFLRQARPEETWPDVADEKLRGSLKEWLLPFLAGIKPKAYSRIDLTSIISSLLNHDQLRQLDEYAPERIEVPSGSKVRVDYESGGPPVLAVKLQELFGMAETPRVAGGRVPVLIHLLSPAGRPVQVTQDLQSFWNKTYPEVKKELSGRYPKHPWPDDPWNAVATKRTKKRR